MRDNDYMLGQLILWAARLLGLVLLYFLVRHFKPNLFYKGWGSLAREFGASAPLPAGLVLHPTSLRVGSEHYNQTAALGLGAGGVYLQRPALAGQGRVLCIPYARLRAVEPPKPQPAHGLPVYGIFRVAGVDLWIDSPYAEQLIAHLPTP